MIKKIKKYLSEIENQKGIKILLACETGSRAWGFPSPDSDYDIRLIYKHKLDWYLSLTEEKDTIELMLEDNNIDISGWDLRKSLKLLWKSNPPLLERIQSPIIYQVDKEFLSGITIQAENCYSKIATIHHYLSMAKKCFDEIETKKNYKLKKMFYSLRASTACNWIFEKDEIPPIHFPTMLDLLKTNKTLHGKIKSLIELKAKEGESYLHSGEPEIFSYIKDSIKYAEENSYKLSVSKGNSSELNNFFRKNLILK